MDDQDQAAAPPDDQPDDRDLWAWALGRWLDATALDPRRLNG